jgi:hypothetical protein
MMPIVLAPDSIVDVVPPDIPIFHIDSQTAIVAVRPPATPVVEATPALANQGVVPLFGPQGPAGPQGPPGESAGAAGSFVWTQQTSTYLVHIDHGMGFCPAGIRAFAFNGDCIEYDSINYPSVDVVEITFDLLFTGMVYLS